MPRHIIRPSPRSPKHDRFVKKLAQELRSPGTQPQRSLVLEEEVPATGSRHVHVVWDQWKKLSDEERTDVIIEAYSQAEGPPYAEQITIASGLTPAEALTLGFLPWHVKPLPSSPGTADAEVKRALEAEAKNTLLGARALSNYGLRYARQEDADEALARLMRDIPQINWTIAQDVYSD